MGRVLSVDYGVKRVGLAVSDPLQLTVRGLGAFAPEKAIAEIVKFHSLDPVESVVIGKPRLSTREFDEGVQLFEEMLRGKLHGVMIVYTGEDFSSVEAEELRKKHFGRSKRRDKELIDELSAMVILENYLGLQN